MDERIGVGTGSPEGTNSAYVRPEQGLVVDPGPPDDDAWEILRRGISATGLAVDDIEHVVVTHWHVDHAGLAPRLAAVASATIYMHERDAAFVRTYRRTHTRRRERDASVMATWGVPEERRSAVIDADTPSPMPPETPVTDLSDGDSVADTKVVHTPGHTEGHIALAGDEAIYVGDAILPSYTPNVGGSDTRADNPLADYVKTLDRLVARHETFKPGHGTSVDPRRIDAIRSHHRTRSERVFEIVDRAGPASPWTVAQQLFGEMHGVHVKFGAGEAAAHLSLLDSLGAVTSTDTSPIRYESDAPDWPDDTFPF